MNAKRWLEVEVENATMVLEAKARLMRDYADKLQSRVNDIKTIEARDPKHIPLKRSEIFNWAIGDIENLMRNFDFNVLARRQVELEFAECEVKSEAKGK